MSVTATAKRRRRQASGTKGKFVLKAIWAEKKKPNAGPKRKAK